MLNYMLVRAEDREILEKSKGKLKWILLDEAHTYTALQPLNYHCKSVVY